MSKSLYKLKDMICDEIDTIAEQGELTPGSLDTVDKLTHSLKSIESVIAMEEGGYSNDAYPMHTGRWAQDGRWSRRYSRDSERGRMVDQLRSMLDEVSTEKERNAIRDCISKVEG